jgi:hypothetical protein
MTPCDYFVTAMRVIGVLQLIRAFEYALSAFDLFSGYYRSPTTTVAACMTHTVLFLVLGVYLVLGAPAVTRAIFPKTSEGESTSGDTERNGKSVA